jgi:TatD DNase family protein
MVDSHCHLAGPEFASDLAAVVDRATRAGVERALVILEASDPAELDQAALVNDRWPAVRFAIGVHPHHAGRYAADPATAGAQVMAAMARQPAARAIGEIGLDFHYDLSDRDVQREVFRTQIGVARALGLPLVIHTREAEEDTFRILREADAAAVGGVFHCFTGDRAMARRAVELGFYISLSGIVTFPRALELQEVAREVPLDRLLVETDSPFLAPVPHRGGRNEPAHVTVVAEVVGALRGTSGAAVGEAAAANFDRLFRP